MRSSYCCHSGISDRCSKWSHQPNCNVMELLPSLTPNCLTPNLTHLSSLAILPPIEEAPMSLLSLPAVFMRGGTSRAVMFHARDLPDRAEWDPIFLAAMGSPDPNGRQLNGMGGGISSLSKVCILAPSDRADADIDYTFAQVQIRDPRVDYRSNCGNMSSAVGPFAVDEGLLRPNGDQAVVRIFNTNTRKIIRS